MNRGINNVWNLIDKSDKKQCANKCFRVYFGSDSERKIAGCQEYNLAALITARKLFRV